MKKAELSDRASTTFINAIMAWVTEHPDYKNQLSRYESLLDGHHGTAQLPITHIQARFGKSDDCQQGLSVWRAVRPVPQWPSGILFVMPFGSLIASYFDSDQFWCWEEGSQAGTAGKNWTDNPYPDDTYEHQSWFIAWLCACLERDPYAMSRLEQGLVAEATSRTQQLEEAVTGPPARVSALAKAIWDITTVAALADAGLSKKTAGQLRQLQSVCDTVLTAQAGLSTTKRIGQG